MEDEFILLFGPDNIQAALKELGPTGTNAEGLVANAADTLAALLESPGVWRVVARDRGYRIVKEDN